MTQEIISTMAESDNPLLGLPEEIRAKIAAASARIQNTSPMGARKIQVANGGTAYRLPNDTTVGKFTAIVVAVKHANRLYTKPYVQGKPELADCVAVLPGQDDGKNTELKPLAECAGKFDTDGTCLTCPKFQWGSNPSGSGRGKLCTEYTLAVIYIPALGDELFLIEQKKARSAKLDKHIRQVTERHGHPMMVYTQFTINEDGKSPHDQNFYATDYAPAEVIARLAGRIEEANAIMVDAAVKSLEANAVAEAVLLSTEGNDPEAAQAPVVPSAPVKRGK